jgi:TolB-like protein
MRKLIYYILILCTPLLASAQITVAIGDFQNQTNLVFLDSWEQKIPEFFHTELSRSTDIILVERKDLNSILNEQALSMTGLINAVTAQEVGRMLSAQYVITGGINKVGHWLRIDAKVINVETGKVVSEKVQSKDEKYLDRMVALLGNNLYYQLTGKGEYKTKMSLKQYPVTHFLIGTLGCAASTILIHNLYIDKRNEYQKSLRLEDFDKLYNNANNLYKTRTVLTTLTSFGLVSTLYFWIKNVTLEEILAIQPTVLPYLASYNKGEFIVGVNITF